MSVSELIEALKGFPPESEVQIRMNREYEWAMKRVDTNANGQPVITDEYE